MKEEIFVKKVGEYKDGGTEVYEDKRGKKYFVDYRIKVKGTGRQGLVYDRHPNEKGAKLLDVLLKTIRDTLPPPIPSKMDVMFICPRCKPTVNSRAKCSIPCPRGGCEAVQVKVPAKTYTRKQVEKLIIKFAEDNGVDGLTAFAFSNENL